MNQLASTFKRIAFLNAAIVSLFAVLILIGWQFETSAIIHFFPNHQLSNPVTALALLGSAVGLFYATRSKNADRQAAKGLGTLILLLGLTKFSEYIFHIQTGVDQWLFSGKLSRLGAFGHPNLIAPNTAIGLSFLGCALLFYNHNFQKKNLLSDYTSIVTALVAFTALVGFLYQSFEFYGNNIGIPMAFPTALCLFLLSTGILLSRSEFGFFSVFTSPYEGNKMARTMIPLSIAIPVVTGLVQLYGNDDSSSSGLNIALFVTANIILFVFAIWRSVESVNKSTKLLEQEIVHANYLEEKARESEHFLNTILENIPEMIFIKEASSLRYVRINKAAEEMMGFSQSQVVGKNDQAFFPKEQADFFSTKDREALTKEELVDIQEEKITSATGVDRWLHTKKIRINNAGGIPEYLVGISVDITARKNQIDQLEGFNKHLEEKIVQRSQELYKSEKKFRTMIENAKDVLTMWDKNARPFYVSPSFEKLTGFTIKDLEETDFINFIYADDRRAATRLLKNVLNHPDVSFAIRLRIRHKNGGFLWIEGSMTNWLHDENVNAIVSNYHDVTEKVTHQQELMKATIQGQEKEKKQLGMELHDNVNQLLASAKLYMDMALADEFAKEQMIGKSRETIMQAMQEIRKLSKELVPHSVEEGNIVETIEDLLKDLELTSGLTVDAHLPAEILHSMNNEQQIAVYRIIQEQINNTMKYAQATRLSVKLFKESGIISLCIEDNGKGFKTSEKRKGIGLSNIENRAQSLSGQSQIYSVPGEGCSLEVNFPV